MNRRRRRPNYFGWALFILVVIFGYYFNQVYLPTQPNPFEPTPTATRSAESFVTEGKALFTQGKLLQSIDAYKQAIQSNPSEPATYIVLAQVQVFAGQYKDAQHNAENALLLNQNNSMANAVRAWALDFQEGKNDEAMTAIQEALKIDPNNGIAHAYYVEILVDSGSFDNTEKAIEESKVALSLAPDSLEAHRARGYLLEATSNYEEAISEYQKAAQINNNIPDLHMSLGRNYRALSVYDKAIEEFIFANTLNPSDPLPELFISRTYATIGEYKKAVQYAEEAVKNDPADAKLHGNLGVMYSRDTDWFNAEKELSLAVHGGTTEDGHLVNGIELSNNSRIAEYYYTYGLVLGRLNRCGEALPIARDLVQRVSSDETAVTNAAEINRICQQNLDATPIPTPADTETPTPSS